MSNQTDNSKSLHNQDCVEYRNHEHHNSKPSQAKRTSDFLKYAAAALSFVSFLTTSNGLTKVLEDEHSWQAYLISFGIQAIVLGVGMKLAEIISFIGSKEQNTDTIFKFKRLISVVIAVLYISSLLFSSFFSFVFLTNNSYKGTKESDYNMRIDEFLIKETRNLSNINYEIGEKLLHEIQAHSAETSEILSKISKEVKNAETYIQKGITKYDVSTIDNIIFKTSSIPEYDEIEVRYGENLKSLVDQAAESFQMYAQSYNRHYKDYEQYFKKFSEKPEYDQREGNLNELKALKVGINETITSIDELTANTDGYYDTRIDNHKKSVKAAYNGLLDSVNKLITAYENMKNDKNASKGSIELSDFYKTIFSPESVSPDSVHDAYTTLSDIVAAYLETGKNLPEEEYEKIKKLSVCITYLGEFEKYKSLDNGIKIFEEKSLNKVLLIQETTTTEKSEEITTAINDEETTTLTTNTTAGTTVTEKSSEIEKSNAESTTKFEQESVTNKRDKQEETTTEETITSPFLEVDKDGWRKNRKETLSNFIRLVKELPDIEILMSNSDEFKNLKKYKNYAEETINDAYTLYRRNLEDISDVERAVNFMFSDHPFMAWFSLLIAFFMDISSCFIGLYDFYVQKREEEDKKKKEEMKPENNENKTLTPTE